MTHSQFNPPRFNPLVAALAAPPIPAVQAWGKAYDGQLGALIDLSQAVPGYPPHPEMLRQLGEAAGRIECAGYGPIEGEDELRAVYGAHLSSLYHVELTAGNVHITSGCNQAFVAAALCVAGIGDVVLTTEPFYFNHRSTLEMFGIGTATVPCHAENGFVPTLDDIRKALTPQVRALALVTPNNPTGAVYPPSLLREVFHLCQERDIWLMVDETYRDFLSDAQEAPHGLFAEAGWQSNLIQLYSFSKSFCIPGHRLGAITAGADTIAAIAKIMDNLQICAPRPPQIAVARSMAPLESWRNDNRKEIADRSVALSQVMAQLDGWKIESIGAYFAFIRHPRPDRSSMQVAEYLAKKLGIVTLPGIFFGDSQNEFLRFAFANATCERLHEVGRRLQKFNMD